MIQPAVIGLGGSTISRRHTSSIQQPWFDAMRSIQPCWLYANDDDDGRSSNDLERRQGETFEESMRRAVQSNDLERRQQGAFNRTTWRDDSKKSCSNDRCGGPFNQATWRDERRAVQTIDAFMRTRYDRQPSIRQHEEQDV
jgi:hypothetical protein